jgi:hypothetical protein
MLAARIGDDKSTGRKNSHAPGNINVTWTSAFEADERSKGSDRLQ